MRTSTLLMALITLTACYRYVPLSSPTLEVGARASARLTAAGTAELARFVGPGVNEVQGQVVSQSDAALTLSVSTVRLHNGVENFWKGERVTIPVEQIAELRERRLARGRSLLSAGTLLLAAAAAVDVFSGPGKGPSRGGGGRPGPR